MIALLVLGGAAHAGQDIRFCIRAHTQWSQGDYEGGDYWQTNGIVPMRGIYVKLRNEFTGLYPFMGFTDANGCTPWMELYQVFDYTLFAESRAEVGTSGIEAYYCPESESHTCGAGDTECLEDVWATCTTDMTHWSTRQYALLSGWSPPSGPITVNVDTLPWDAQVGWMSVASRVLWLTSWNFNSSYPLQYFEKSMGLGGCGVNRQVGPVFPGLPAGANICSTFNATSRPWSIAHETGHTIAFRREHGEDSSCVGGCDAADLNGQIDISADEQGCFGETPPNDPSQEWKGRFTKEYQATAAREGWADFVSAATFNDAGDSSCVFNLLGGVDADMDMIPAPAPPLLPSFMDNGPDGNNDGMPDSGSTYLVSCDEEPITAALCSDWTSVWGPSAGCSDTSPFFVSTRDWLSDAIGANDPRGCHGNINNRSTEYDWLRFWWDLHTTEGVPLSRLNILLDNMDQRDWDPDDNGASSQGSTGLTDDVTWRLTQAAANTVCFDPSDACTSYVASQVSNGQDH